MAADDAVEETPLLKPELQGAEAEKNEEEGEVSDTTKTCASFCTDLFLILSLISIASLLSMLCSQICVPFPRAGLPW